MSRRNNPTISNHRLVGVGVILVFLAMAVQILTTPAEDFQATDKTPRFVAQLAKLLLLIVPTSGVGVAIAFILDHPALDLFFSSNVDGRKYNVLQRMKDILDCDLKDDESYYSEATPSPANSRKEQ